MLDFRWRVPLEAWYPYAVALSDASVRRVGRYLLFGELASGGMATVHLGRLLGPVGFGRTVAIKRLHAQFARDPEFVSMFVDEARLAARIRHPNVVSVLDIAAAQGELFLVMDFVIGDSLSQLVRGAGMVSKTGGTGVPPRIAASLMVGVLQGVHAAHETRGERGEPLHIVHRDISPQNVLVGHDGVARLIDFGIAKAMGRLHASQSDALKGKLAYMAPEQLQGNVTRASDVFSTGVVLWELLTGQRLFAGETDAHTYSRVREAIVRPPSELLSGSAQAEVLALDAVVLRALHREPDLRFETAKDFAVALEKAISPASALQVAEWMGAMVGSSLEKRMQLLREVEEATTGDQFATFEAFTQALSARDAEGNAVLDDNVDPAATPNRTADEPSEIRTEFSLVTGSQTVRDDDLRTVPARSRRVAVFALLGAATVLLLFVVFHSRGESSPATSGPRVSEPTPQVVPTPQPAATQAASAVTMATAEAPSAAPKVRPRPNAKRTNRECNPPFTTDEHGTKHFKPTCF